MKFWPLILGCALIVEIACVHVPVEPSLEKQLWKEKECFAHILPEWRHLELRELAGSVVAGGISHADRLPGSLVFIRSMPGGRVQQTVTDANGEFRLSNIADGTYELAICRDGWNPWRGTVTVSRTGRAMRVVFELMLGQ